VCYILLLLLLLLLLLPRCYWRGMVQFSDGSTGSMAFSTCSRHSIPHLEYLDGERTALATESPLHYILGTIHDHSTGEHFGVEPRDFKGYRSWMDEQSSDADRGFADRHPTQLADHVTYRMDDLREAAGITSSCGGNLHVYDHVHDRGHDHDHDHVHGRGLKHDDHAAVDKPGVGHDLDRAHAHHHDRDGDVRTISHDAPSDEQAMGDDLQRRVLSSLGTRYVELQVSNDFLRTAEHGVGNVGDDTLAVINQVALFYGSDGVSAGLDYDIQVVLVGQNVFVDEDPWTGRGTVTYSSGEVDIDELLTEFSSWVGINVLHCGTACCLFDSDRRICAIGLGSFDQLQLLARCGLQLRQRTTFQPRGLYRPMNCTSRRYFVQH